ALGVTFTLRGADVTIDNLSRLPVALAERLQDFAETGWLFTYFGGDRLDAPALTLGAQLGVVPVVVDTIAALRDAIRQLESDKRQHGREIGIDIETAPKLEYRHRPPLRLTADGAVAAHQTQPKDRTGLSPH